MSRKAIWFAQNEMSKFKKIHASCDSHVLLGRVQADRDFSSDLGPNTSSKHEAFHRKDNPARKMGFGREDGDIL